MENITAVAGPVAALNEAIDCYESQADFQRALTGRTGKPVTSSHIRNWRVRDNGAPAEFCPAIEYLTGVRCERLRPDVADWAALRVKTGARKRVAAEAASA